VADRPLSRFRGNLEPSPGRAIYATAELGLLLGFLGLETIECSMQMNSTGISLMAGWGIGAWFWS
jgi:hypothetical protein